MKICEVLSTALGFRYNLQFTLAALHRFNAEAEDGRSKVYLEYFHLKQTLKVFKVILVYSQRFLM